MGDVRKISPKTAPALQLVASGPNVDAVAALEGLLADARRGHIVGVAFVAMYRGREYIADIAGECRPNPTFTRGMIRVLDDKIGQMIAQLEP